MPRTISRAAVLIACLKADDFTAVSRALSGSLRGLAALWAFACFFRDLRLGGGLVGGPVGGLALGDPGAQHGGGRVARGEGGGSPMPSVVMTEPRLS